MITVLCDINMNKTVINNPFWIETYYIIVEGEEKHNHSSITVYEILFVFTEL